LPGKVACTREAFGHNEVRDNELLKRIRLCLQIVCIYCEDKKTISLASAELDEGRSG